MPAGRGDRTLALVAAPASVGALTTLRRTVAPRGVLHAGHTAVSLAALRPLAGTAGAAVGLGAAAGIASNMASTRAPQRPLAQLVDVVSGESHSITSAQVTIGRERSVSDIALRDPNVSRRHAQLTFTGSDWSIEDLNSTNGTLVNNRRITRCPLRNGDLLTFGLSTFEFRG